MSEAADLVKSLIKSTPNLAMMSVNLFWMYSTLGWRVRRTRRAFERELVSQGMSREDAKRLSACFTELMNSLKSALKHGIAGGLTVT